CQYRLDSLQKLSLHLILVVKRGQLNYVDD
ncbi:MAG: hypothetical protein ACI9FJ_002972, partial [Alteromonadaceae bacterium]